MNRFKWVWLVMVMLVAFVGCTRNIPEIKSVADAYFKNMGWEVLGYEGYQWGLWGGKAWYLVRDPSIPDARYSVFLIKRGGEIHLYNPPGSVWNDNKSIQHKGSVKIDK